MAYRATLHSIIGFSPYFLVHGLEANLPTEILTRDIEDKDLSEEDFIQDIVTRLKTAFNKAKENIVKNKEKSKQYYDKSLGLKYFTQGNILLLDTTVKRGRSKKLKRP